MSVASCRAEGGAETTADAGAQCALAAGAISDRLSAESTAFARDERSATARDGGAMPSSAASVAPIDALGTIYPRDVPPHPLATRLCEALHAVPARRKAACCGGEPASFLMAECVRVLGATLHAGTVALEEAAVDRCASAMMDAVLGCAWITPNLPSPPEACQQLVRGKLERGSVCRSSLECAGDMHCEGVSPTKTGICVPPGGEGAGCGAHVDVLGTYLSDRHLGTTHPFCAEHCSLVTHKCGPPPAVGATCVAHVNCAASQLCVEGRCSAAAPAKRGERCGPVPCANGLRCVDAACVPLAGHGETCRADEDCAVGACVPGADGPSQCGPQCSASLDALGGRDAGAIMGLPRRPRAFSGSR